jgi:ribonuclease HI
LIHLLFVDDVLLLSKADLPEWLVIIEVLQLFCSASGLSINYSKSSVHFWGLSEADLLTFKGSLPFTFVHLSEGFKYLGFQLRLGASTPENWKWLVARFESRIHFWCNKWLSLGGRFILVKSILESLPVFWMSLEKIPKKIVTILRRLIYNFLWNCSPGHSRFHLCNWEALSKPRRFGGWGLMDLSSFNTALLANSLWRAVTVDSIWHRVIVDKYLGAMPLVHWIRKPFFQQRNVSHFWKGMVTSLPVILHWLVWKPGAGTEIRIGVDNILGLGERSLLSDELRTQLQFLNITLLSQVNLRSNNSSLPDRWMNSGDLRLCQPIASEWDRFIKALKGSGISLSACPDSLRWAGGDATGITSVKNFYTALHSQRLVTVDRTWFSLLWRWDIPLKLKLFIWLAGKGKSLTWDALQRRGWKGPGICPLCRRDAEDIQHLLVFCSFTRAVWSLVLSQFPRLYSWNGSSLSHCFTLWLAQATAPKYLPVFVCWHIWNARNRAIFDSRLPSLNGVFYKIVSSFHWKQSSLKTQIPKSCDFTQKEGYTVACFDGAAQVSGGNCGAGGFFKSHPSRCTWWFLNCGSGTNTKAELLGLMGLPLLASCWSISHLHVLGDSRVIIDWISKKTKLHSIHIDSWKDRVMGLSTLFADISFHHLPRSRNREADALSKRALKEEFGRLSVFHSDRGRKSPISSINVFE